MDKQMTYNKENIIDMNEGQDLEADGKDGPGTQKKEKFIWSYVIKPVRKRD